MSIRVVLTEEDFQALVKGETVTKDDLEGGKPIMMILEDIGFGRMGYALERAMSEYGTKT